MALTAEEKQEIIKTYATHEGDTGLSAFLFISTDLIISQMRSFVYYISEHLFCLICNLFFLQAYSLYAELMI